jgi:DNA-binding NarL/FixJ family response regulator
MVQKKRIIIAEDQKILREGLKALLNSSEDFEVVGDAENGLDAIRAVKMHSPDLLLLDISMPKMNGLSVIKEIKTQNPKIKILMLTVHESEEYIAEAFKSGADGYCLKDASYSELVMAINSILSDNRYISPGISQKILEGYLGDRDPTKPRSSWGRLTKREKEILKLVGEGYKNREIAGYLCISPKTVEKHRSNIMRKLDLHTASALTAYAIERGLVAKSFGGP